MSHGKNVIANDSITVSGIVLEYLSELGEPTVSHYGSTKVEIAWGQGYVGLLRINNG